MSELYQRVAQHFADKINILFESEKTLEQVFKLFYEHLEFDRTEHWAGIIYKILSDAWKDLGPEVKCEPTGTDKLQILRYAHRMLDYNIFTQVLLNLQGYTGMHYMTGDAQKHIDTMKTEWPKDFKLDPFAPKAKMVKQAEAITDEQKRYNEMISTLRALRIITQFTPQISFRVSAKGQTPAFADSRNISMIGMGGDKYLKTLPELGTFYITWDFPAQMTALLGARDGAVALSAEGIPYEFLSKSGGGVLNEVLFARRIMYEVFGHMDITKETCIMVPRMNSVLIVTDKWGENLKKAFEKIVSKWPMVKLVEGARV